MQTAADYAVNATAMSGFFWQNACYETVLPHQLLPHEQGGPHAAPNPASLHLA